MSQSPTEPQPSEAALWVNGERHLAPAGVRVAGLIEQLGLGERRVAVAVNGEVVRRAEFAMRTLSPDDRVEILEAVGGG